MKGVLFGVLEEVVVTYLGEDAWDDVIRRSGVDGSYTSLGDYPDAELFAVVDAIAEVMATPVGDVLVMGGELGFSLLADRHRYVIEGMNSWREVLEHLDDIIHPEVRKIYSEAQAPQFDVVSVPDGLVVTYNSKRRLCRLAEGLARGTGAYFGTPVDVRHLSCIDDGDASCVMHVVG